MTKSAGATLADSGSLPGTALETLGTILAEDQGRDAVHLAAVAVRSAERLFRGQHIGLIGDRTVSANAGELVGIVDPFLSAAVLPGNWFWMLLYPRTITSLRHVWTHPTFPEGAPAIANSREQSEEWLRNFCNTHDTPQYETVIAALNGQWPANTEGDEDFGFEWGGWDGDSLHFRGIDAHSAIPEEFWHHVEVVLGRKIEWEKKAKHFTCGC